MTLPTNDDLANCELSFEELEAIAAGGFWSTVEHIAGDVIKYTVIGGLLFSLGFIGSACGGNATCNNGGTPPKNLF